MKKFKINKNYIIQKPDNKSTIFDGEESVFYALERTVGFIFNN